MDNGAVDETAPHHRHTKVPNSRLGRTWLAISAGMLALILILVFVLENLKSVKVSFFGATWRVPLALDLLFAAILGGLVVFFLGTLRIVQLRRLARHRLAPGAEADESRTEVA